jgi:hypothetical protein
VYIENCNERRPDRRFRRYCGNREFMIPKQGITIMYTSGCPKNQNRCWNKTVSPPPEKSKTEVLKCRSDKSKRIAISNAGLAKIIIREPIRRASTKKERSSRRFLRIGAPT